MNTLVIYDSQFGNTEKIAQQIAETLREFGAARAVRVTEFEPRALEGVEVLLVGGPTQGWGESPAVKDFFAHLERAQMNELFAAEFDTRFDKPRWLTGSAARKMEKQFQQLGAIVLLPPESFFVEHTEGPLANGELERATRWAYALYQEYARRARPEKVAALKEVQEV